MACDHNKICPPIQPEVSCTKCDDVKKSNPTAANKCQPFLTNTIERYADRQEDLDERHRQLKDKISTMEKLLPALIACGMCNKSYDEKNQACESSNAALNQVREMMRKLSPLPDPADELVAELATCVKQLNRETAELHDKIINADIQLEENCMELESLGQANRELEEQIRHLEDQLNSQTSLQSISSEDRICLSRIRKLAKDEIKMKSNIRELEEREKVLCCQIEKIFGSSDKPLCEAARGQKHHAHRPKSRKKKHCNTLETSTESLFKKDKKCDKSKCDMLNSIIPGNIPVMCCCLKDKVGCSYNFARTCEHLLQRKIQMPKKSISSKLCNCNLSAKEKQQKKKL
ncbi:uncharacterized protein LOC100120476 isoform X1 [Nasonia vitripennis]|uniref:Uncharacterized protein n=1 Tax=Nasonia vitripennis TaxID=7425 RepID=A0A7M7H6X0_NASVI|nr:uncharacterized protein LOC100120476 isoform X1 [Nasonia vitripennis]